MEIGKVCIMCGSVSRCADFYGPFRGKLHICPDCFKEIRGYKESNVRNYLLACDKHSFYITSNNNLTVANCPYCIDEIKTVKCIKCGSDYKTKDKHIERIKNNQTINICEDCEKDIPGEGNVVKHCFNYDSYIKVPHNFANCPLCGENPNKFKNTCKKCGKEFYSNNVKTAYCDECRETIHDSEAVLRLKEAKKNPFVKIRDNIVMYPIFDDGSNTDKKVLTCPCCHRPFYKNSSNHTYCGRCEVIVTCPECNNDYSIPPSEYNRRNPLENNYCSKQCRTASTNKKRTANKIIYKQCETDISTYTEITDENVLDFQFAGVWFIVDEDGTVLNVHMTSNIYKEYLLGTKREIKSYTKNRKIKSFFLSGFNDLIDGFDAEMDFAIKTNAKFWHPAPGIQTKKYFDFMKER